ncbi:MAG: phosphoglycerate kinase [Phycisphaerae bacterium]
MATKTIADIDVSGKTVLMRVDFNVPLDGKTVTNDKRIVAALPSIKKVLDGDGKLVLMSHLGRPKGEAKDEFSLKPAADKLAEHLGKEVKLAPAAIAGDEAKKMASDLQPGEVLCLENVRFDAREDSKDIDEVMAFGRELAELGEVYVNDAFGTCHRKHASMWAVPQVIQEKGGAAVAGFLVEKEIKYLGEAVDDPKRPFLAILGGAKVSDKIKLISSLLDKVDRIIIGGAMAYTLLKAKGVAVGKSRVEEDQVDEMKSLLEKAGDTIVLPSDHLGAEEFDSDDANTTDGVEIPENLMGLDIGPKTIEEFKAIIADSKTIVWNGPMGVFERDAYAKGTREVAQAVADATKGGAVTVIGGGDSATAVEEFGLEDDMTHVSTGGGASLTYLEGKPMPPIEVLDQK